MVEPNSSVHEVLGLLPHTLSTPKRRHDSQELVEVVSVSYNVPVSSLASVTTVQLPCGHRQCINAYE